MNFKKFEEIKVPLAILVAINAIAIVLEAILLQSQLETTKIVAYLRIGLGLLTLLFSGYISVKKYARNLVGAGKNSAKIMLITAIMFAVPMIYLQLGPGFFGLNILVIAATIIASILLNLIIGFFAGIIGGFIAQKVKK